jgi:uncharacterized protein YqiB (DUF1249 family)
LRREPDLIIRIYHDARIAEAMSGFTHRGRRAQNIGTSVQRAWNRNRFLHKWLGYCLFRGHRFVLQTPLDSPMAGAAPQTVEL